MENVEELVKEYFLQTQGYNWDDLPEFYKSTPMFTLEDVLKIIEQVKEKL